MAASMTRREFLGASAIGLSACAAEQPEQPRRPNILFAIADDQSWPHASALGCKWIQTPAFDRIAREGALFTHSFATCPSCTPSRTSILSGRHVWQTGEGGVLYGTLPADMPLATHLLEDAGYHVGYTGKPWQPGDWKAGGLMRHPNGKEYNTRKHSDPIPAGIDERDYAANFGDFLADRPADAPFFFWYGCTEPHRVYEDGVGVRHGKNLDDVDVPDFLPDTELVRSDLADYAFEIEWFDAQLTKMLAKLEEIGELDNTLVIVTSDNGMPFPRAKVNLYGLGRTHAARDASGPSRSGQGTQVEAFVSHVDFAPTWLEIAGVDAPDRHGRLELASLTAPRRRARRSPRLRLLGARASHLVPTRTARPTPRVRSVPKTTSTSEILSPTAGRPEARSSSRPTKRSTATSTLALRRRSWSRSRASSPNQYALGFGKRPAEELYRIADDPGQVNNLADDPAYVAG